MARFFNVVVRFNDIKSLIDYLCWVKEYSVLISFSATANFRHLLQTAWRRLGRILKDFIFFKTLKISASNKKACKITEHAKS